MIAVGVAGVLPRTSRSAASGDPHYEQTGVGLGRDGQLEKFHRPTSRADLVLWRRLCTVRLIRSCLSTVRRPIAERSAEHLTATPWAV